MLTDFCFLKKLGEGAFSSVFLVKRISDSMLYALKKVKLMTLSEKEKQNALNEVRLLASINHPNVCAYKESFIDESTATLCIVMEYADNGDILSKVQEHMKKGTYFKEYEVWNIFAQMLLGLKALHDFKICHRDIKSANIFMNTKGEIKLGDFNVSKVAKKGMLYTQTGTPYYACPEVWKDRPYDQKSDLWSLGCVLYEMLSLRPPFKAPDMKGLYKKVVSADYPPIMNSKYSSDISGLVKIILQVNPMMRPNCVQLLQMSSFTKNVTDLKILDQIKALKDNKLYAVINGDDGELLNTIKLPKILRQLQEKLPKANYRRQLSQPARIAASNILNSNDPTSNPISPKYDKIIQDLNKHRPVSGRAGANLVSKHPSLNVKPIDIKDYNGYNPSLYHKYYEDQFATYDNKENLVDNYAKYKKAAEIVRKSSDPSLQNDSYDKKRRDTSNKYSNERQQFYNNYVQNDYTPSNPYGVASNNNNYGLGNYVNPTRASRNIPQKQTNAYDHLR